MTNCGLMVQVFEPRFSVAVNPLLKDKLCAVRSTAQCHWCIVAYASALPSIIPSAATKSKAMTKMCLKFQIHGQDFINTQGYVSLRSRHWTEDPKSQKTPLIGTTGAIPMKILQGHAFLVCHPSAKFRPNRFSFPQRNIHKMFWNIITRNCNII